LALLVNLSEHILNQPQNNTVFPSQEKVDRVGFEPTTSALENITTNSYYNSFNNGMYHYGLVETHSEQWQKKDWQSRST
jgi:hypothetical protein